MAGTGDRLLQQERPQARERGQGVARRPAPPRVPGARQEEDAAPAAAVHRLEDRGALHERKRLVEALRAGNRQRQGRGNAQPPGQARQRPLVAQELQRLGRGPHPGQARGRHRPGEGGGLGGEADTGVQGVSPQGQGGGDEGVDVVIGLDLDDVVQGPQPQAVTVGGGEHADGAKAQGAGRAGQPQGGGGTGGDEQPPHAGASAQAAEPSCAPPDGRSHRCVHVTPSCARRRRSRGREMPTTPCGSPSTPSMKAPP